VALYSIQKRSLSPCIKRSLSPRIERSLSPRIKRTLCPCFRNLNERLKKRKSQRKIQKRNRNVDFYATMPNVAQERNNDLIKGQFLTREDLDPLIWG